NLGERKIQSLSNMIGLYVDKMDVKVLAQKYYPKLWDIDRIKALVVGGKLTEADYKEITGETYTKGV
ncbi:XkdX family protein, partial [Enterocloster lavalensis]|uniref:XkdX family protein n=1 Tax=Enterocloster lavalensis TaxID=460384 RepID=UPI002666B6C4